MTKTNKENKVIPSVYGYPCHNPELHEYGTLPCCEGIVLDERYLDWPRIEKALKRYATQSKDSEEK